MYLTYVCRYTKQQQRTLCYFKSQWARCLSPSAYDAVRWTFMIKNFYPIYYSFTSCHFCFPKKNPHHLLPKLFSLSINTLLIANYFQPFWVGFRIVTLNFSNASHCMPFLFTLNVSWSSSHGQRRSFFNVSKDAVHIKFSDMSLLILSR